MVYGRERESLAAPGEKVKWRNDRRTLFTRPIYTKEFPYLLKLMVEDDLVPFLTDDGLKWFLGRYEITPKVIKQVWGLTNHQYRRLSDYIIYSDWKLEVL